MSLPADLAALLDDLRPAAARAVALERRRRRLRVGAGALAAAVVLAGAALAAVRLLGEPAPAYVQAQLVPLSQSVFEGWNRPLPSVTAARVVAETPNATLYGIGNVQGDYCTELVGVTRGFVLQQECASRRGVHVVHAPFLRLAAVTDGVEPPVVDFGRAPAATASLRATLADGSTEDVKLGLEGFWAYEPTAQDAARRGPLSVEALDATGAVLQRWSFDPPLALAVEGSPIARVSGRVEIPAARSVQFAAPSLLRTIPLGGDGGFSWSTPAGARLFSLDVAALDAGGVHLASGTIFEQDTVEQMIAQAKGEAPTMTTTAPSLGLPPTLRLPTAQQYREALADCVAAWNATAGPAQRQALARTRNAPAWIAAVPSLQPAGWQCLLGYTTPAGLVSSTRSLGRDTWTPARLDPVGFPQGPLARVDASGRITLLKQPAG
ncbi:MAG: hypothetical protein ACXVZL_00925 [Gaiellaceae bacterium]